MSYCYAIRLSAKEDPLVQSLRQVRIPGQGPQAWGYPRVPIAHGCLLETLQGWVPYPPSRTLSDFPKGLARWDGLKAPMSRVLARSVSWGSRY